MRRNERLKLIAKVRKQARAELLAKIHAKRERNFELYDRTFEQISQAETELFQNSPAFLKYQQLRRSMGDKKRTHGLQNGNWKAP